MICRWCAAPHPSPQTVGRAHSTATWGSATAAGPTGSTGATGATGAGRRRRRQCVFAASVPCFPLRLPSRFKHLNVITDTLRGVPPWPWPLSQPLRPNAVLATRLNNSSVHKPRSHPPLPTWRPRRRQATPHSTGGCTPAQGAPQWAPPYPPAPTPTVAWSSDAPSSSQKQTHFVSLGLHIRQSGLASDHLDHAARVFVVLDAYQVCP